MPCSSSVSACACIAKHEQWCIQAEMQSWQSLEEDGQGRVLIVDGGGSMRCALLGDNIAEMAYKNGWSVSTAPHER